jgi:thymidine phosphorylase
VKVTPLVDAIQSGQSQPKEQLEAFVNGVANGTVSLDEATHWLRAVHRFGCTVEDKVGLTAAMIASGVQLSWEQGPPVVDKHSTGGVGDKMSLVLAPALAACGCRVPMLAGRGLGHTGGTIDKLESIPGFSCNLTPEEMQVAVQEVGCCIAVQNDAIAPADGVLYALRDVTDTIDSVPLITASIVSKKAAEGLDALVLDVKVGRAAFMKTLDEATELAQSMVDTAQGLGIQTVAQITSMDEPIGTHVGNALEVVESIEVLKGKGSPDTRALVVLQGGALLAMAKGIPTEVARAQLEHVLDNGEALAVFKAMCIQQGVEVSTATALLVDPQSVLGTASQQTTVNAKSSGFVRSIDAMGMAHLARTHGAGRFALDDKLDHLIGFVLHCQRGDEVKANQPLLTFHHSTALNQEELDRLENLVQMTTSTQSPTVRLVQTIE